MAKPKKPQHPFTTKLLKELKSATDQFGTYSFDDKGPEEVMDMTSLIQGYKALPPTEKVQVAKEVKGKNHRANTVLSHILSQVEATVSEVEFKEILQVAHEEVQEYFDPNPGPMLLSCQPSLPRMFLKIFLDLRENKNLNYIDLLF